PGAGGRVRREGTGRGARDDRRECGRGDAGKWVLAPARRARVASRRRGGRGPLAVRHGAGRGAGGTTGRLRSLLHDEALRDRGGAGDGEAAGRASGRRRCGGERARRGCNVPHPAARGQPAQRTHVVTVAFGFWVQVRSPANALAPTVMVAVVLVTDGGVAPRSMSETRTWVVQLAVRLRRWTESFWIRPGAAVLGSRNVNDVRVRFAFMAPGASARL